MQLFWVSHWCHRENHVERSPGKLSTFPRNLHVRRPCPLQPLSVKMRGLMHKPCCTGTLRLKCFFTTLTSLCLFFCFCFFGLLKLWRQPSTATEVKHLKPMSNTSIHADSSCCWTLSSSSQPDTSLWEEWVRCVPPRLAGGRIGDIFRMTRGAHALK